MKYVSQIIPYAVKIELDLVVGWSYISVMIYHTHREMASPLMTLNWPVLRSNYLTINPF